MDYPDRPLDRLTTAFRIFVAIPILIVLGAASGGIWQWTSDGKDTAIAAGAGGLLWQNRVVGYALVLVTDLYPPFRPAP